ncbi:IPT/TIG domain-containing protein [Micromonospora saelicesensis]|uniref:IPT/TIG domain-containing protein n=1 Tax=Micromonospora saelicesensis TaxID=285676 RepID=UPI003CEDA27D
MATRSARKSYLRAAVAVLLAGGALAAPGRAFAQALPVVVNSVSPVVAEPGATVEVHGSGFTGTSGVTVNGSAASVTQVTDDRLAVALPAGATSGPVVVTTPAGSGTSAGDLFVARPPWRGADVQFTGRLTQGVSTTVAISATDRIAVLTVAAAAGKRSSLALTNSTFGTGTSAARVSVYRPDGSTAVAATGFGSSGIFLEPLPATADGTWTVVVDPQGTATGQVEVTAHDVPADSTSTADTNGTTTTVTTTAPGQNASVTVSGTAGQRLTVVLSGSTFGSSGVQVGVRRPDGVSLVSAQSFSGSGFLDQFALPLTGTYSITVDPVKAATGQIGTQVYDVSGDASATASLAGTPVTVTTLMPGQNASVTFAGAVGQRVSVYVASHSMGSSPQLTVRQPDGSTLIGAQTIYTSLLVEPVTIPVTGKYTVVINPSGTNVGSAVVSAYGLPDDIVVPATAGGAAVTAATAVPGLNGRVEFSASAGMRASVRIASQTYGSGRVSVGLLGPDRSVVASPQSVYTSAFIEPVSLAAPGTYAVTVDPAAAATGSASVQVYDVPTDPVLTTTPGTPVNAAVAVPGQNIRVQFPGSAGRRLSLRVPAHTYGSGNVSIGVRKPDGTALITSQAVYSSLFVEPVSLPVDGTYIVTVDPIGAATGAATVEIHDVPATPDVPATIGGAAVTVSTSAPGQNGSVTFRAAAGQRISVQLSGSSYGSSGARASLIAADGAVVVAPVTLGAAGVLLGPVTTTAGIYTVLVDPQGSVVGQVTVRVNDSSEIVLSATPSGGPVTVATTAAGQNATVRFPGSAGQRIFVTVTGSTYGGSSNLSVSLRAPDGTVLAGPTAVGTGEVNFDSRVLSASGDHSVLVDPQGSATGQVKVEVLLVADNTTSTAVVGGGPVTLPMTAVGQDAVVTFTAGAGQRVAILASDSTYPLGRARATIIAPDGSVVFAATTLNSTSTFWDPVGLPTAGTYRILIDPQGSTVGRLAIRLYAVPADATVTSAPGGPRAAVTTTVPGQTARVTFAARTEQRIAARIQRTGSTGTVDVRLTAPSGAVLDSRSMYGTSLDLMPTAIPVAGTYTLVVDPQSTGVGDFTVQIFAVPDDVTVVATLGGPPVVAQTFQPGQTAAVTFTGNVGDRALVIVKPRSGTDSDTTSDWVYLDLNDPDGDLLDSGMIFTDSEHVLGPVTLNVNGSYSLLIDPTGTRFGQFDVQILRVPATTSIPVITDGAAQLVAVDKPGAVGSVSFTGAAGARISLLITDSEWFRNGISDSWLTVSLVDAAGDVLDTGTIVGEGFFDPITLPAAGTYRVLVDPNGAAVGSAKVAVYSVAADVTLPVTLNGSIASIQIAPGQVAAATFSASADLQVRAAVVNAPGRAEVTVLRPDGSEVCEPEVVWPGEAITCQLPGAGSYVLRIDPVGSFTGSWSIEVYEGTGTPRIDGDAEQWYSTTSQYLAWTTDSSTSIAGYSVVVDTNAGTIPPATVSQTADWLRRDYPQGVSYLHVRAKSVDGTWGRTAHRAIRIDTAAPVVSSLTSPSHPDPASPVGSLDLRLVLVAAPQASGVVGYSIRVSRSAEDRPDGTITTTGSAYQTRLDGEGEWYVSAAAISGSGIEGAPSVVRVVADLPAGPPVISSVTHPVAGNSYDSGRFVGTWRLGAGTETAASESVGVVDGWSVRVDHAAATVPPTTVTTTEARLKTDLAPGTWWLHVRGREASGAWSATAHFPIVVTAPARAFTAPVVGEGVWDAVDVRLPCASTDGSVRFEAAHDDGDWHVIGTAAADAGGACTVGWTTDLLVGGVASWPDGHYRIRAVTEAGTIAQSAVDVGNTYDGISRLRSDYRAGVIDLAAYAGYLMEIATGGSGLPDRYRVGAPSIGDPRESLQEVLATWESLDEGQRAVIGNANEPVILTSPPARRDQASGNECGWQVRIRAKLYDCRAESVDFVVYYVSGTVGGTTGGSRPDWVERMIGALELARGTYESMSYRVPSYQLTVALDPNFPDGSGVAIPALKICPICGTTSPLSIMAADPAGVTEYLPRHEYFHFVEYEYIDHRRFAQKDMNWWMEASAEWAAHQVEERSGAQELGSYYANLGEFLKYSDERYDEGDSVVSPGGPEYGAFVLAEYLEERFGDDVIRDTWAHLGGLASMPRDAIQDTMRQGGSSFGDEIETFRQWAYVLDAGEAPVGFRDPQAEDWRSFLEGRGAVTPHDTVTLDDSTIVFDESHDGGFRIQQSGAKYVEIDNAAYHEGDLTISYGHIASGDVRLSVLALDGNRRPTEECGGPRRVPDSGEVTIQLSSACPHALMTIVHAEDPGWIGTWLSGDYRVRFRHIARVLSNSTVQVGFGRYGNLISNGVGLRLTGNEDSEVIQRGCYCEGWGLAEAGQAGGSVTDATGVRNLSPVSFSTISDTAIAVVDAPGEFRVTTVASPSASANLYRLHVVVTSTRTVGSSGMVHYRRAVDWDMLPDLGGFYSTFASRDGAVPSYVGGITNDGFADPNPQNAFTDLGATGLFSDFGPDNTGALIDLKLGSFEPGQSKAFDIYYGVATSQAAALTAVTNVDAPLYAFGKPGTPDGKAQGTPFTAILAVDGRDIGASPRLTWSPSEEGSQLATVPGARREKR